MLVTHKVLHAPYQFGLVRSGLICLKEKKIRTWSLDSNALRNYAHLWVGIAARNGDRHYKSIEYMHSLPGN